MHESGRAMPGRCAGRHHLTCGLALILAAILVLSGPAGRAHAQRADRPDVRAGDRWDFVVYYAEPSTKPNRTWVVTSVGDARIEGTENGEPLVLSRDLNVLDSPRYRDQQSQALLFPLEVGTRWRYTSEWLFKPKNSTGTSVVDVVVVAWEKIRVPAGEFDAFKLEAKAALRGIAGIGSRIDAESSTTYWYAPAARAIVKSVVRHPYLGAWTVELVEFAREP